MDEDQSRTARGPDWLPHELCDAIPMRGVVGRATFQDVDAWREGISGAFVPLVPEAIGPGQFRSSFQKIQRGEISLARIEGSAQRVRRGAREIATTRGDFAYFNIQLSGVGRVRGGGSVRRTEAGSGAIVLAENQFELEFESPFTQLCVGMPVDWMCDRLGLPPGILVTRHVDLQSGAGRVVRAALGALIAAENAAEATQYSDLFGIALDHALRPEQAPSQAPDRSLIPALGRLLGRRLGDSTLTPASAAGALGCSVRTLHAACEREGRSFGRRLLDARLDAAERALRSAPVARGHIGPVAFACGFSDRSHFSRAFRARFGVSPGAYLASYDTRRSE
jgi:AraC-like DNA-binding protein